MTACPVRALPAARCAGRRVGDESARRLTAAPAEDGGGTVLGDLPSSDIGPSLLRPVPPPPAAGWPLASFRSVPAPPRDRSWRQRPGEADPRPAAAPRSSALLRRPHGHEEGSVSSWRPPERARAGSFNLEAVLLTPRTEGARHQLFPSVAVGCLSRSREELCPARPFERFPRARCARICILYRPK